jgi:glycosyltransferase involved in cell wall biosynthesis
LKIAILGTRGIPNNYGGFEQCAEYLALGMTTKGFEVTVYNSHNHPYKQDTWNGAKIIHRYDPEYKLGSAGQFIYDFNCIMDIRKRDFDVILQLGYASSSVWGWLLPRRHTIVTTNMDGLEWKRTKYSRLVKAFLLYAEKLAVKHSDYLIADSIGIQNYLEEKYSQKSTFIPYGADIFQNPDESILAEYSLEAYGYDMLLARLEPENSIEIILDGVVLANNNCIFLVVGKHDTKHGEYLKAKFMEHENIKFMGAIYNLSTLSNLRYFSNLYFHGHTVGGTNPSLLEAMASGSLVCANNNPFNRFILNDDALYFSDANDVAKVLTNTNKTEPTYNVMIANNFDKIKIKYSWEMIINQYASHFKKIWEEKGPPGA